MCAINGILDYRGRSHEQLAEAKLLVRAMNAATAHRGPDGTGVWQDPLITLGHNRLAIIDLSEAAAQPMQSASGRFVIVYNGEVYNFKELRGQLAPQTFKTNSDTEVILAAFEKWGYAAFEKLRGMFALAIWDTQEKELVLARDQSGIKPLYWREAQGVFYFSSELKGLLSDSSLPRRIDKDALRSYLRLRYVPEPLTMIEGVHKLPSSSFVSIKNGVANVMEYAPVPLLPLASGRREDTLLHIESLINSSVKQELVSDRPLGVFLSGGLDSTILLDAALRQTGSMSTFSLRFEVSAGEQPDKFNADADLAARTAAHYRTLHTEVLFSETDFVRLLPEAVRGLDQPVGNATALSQMYLSREARRQVVVALVGEGGDELFGGYPRYRLSQLTDLYQKMPAALRSVLSVIPQARKLNTPKGILRIAQFMFEKDAMLARAVREEFVSREPEERFAGALLDREASDFTQLFMDADRRSWLPDEALARTDLMTMASALEARVPLLNYDLVAFASRLPSTLRVGGRHKSKQLLREAFAARLPAHILHAPKRGFFSPIAKWLRRPALKDISRQALSAGFHPNTDALLNFPELEKLFERHITGEQYAAPLIWTLVSLRLWAREFGARL